MGVAYYIEVDKADLDVSNVDGKAVGRAMEALNALAEELRITPWEDIMGQSMDAIDDMLGEEIEMDDEAQGAVQWFEAEAGLIVIDALLAELCARSGRIKSTASVVMDLESYREALNAAKGAGAKWHLAIDF
jgi:hypothetical protein